jgi:hypothetical protein
MAGETLRTEAYLLATLLADNTTGEISPLDLRDAVYSLARYVPKTLPFGVYEARPLASSATLQDLEVWSWTDQTFPVISGQTPTTDLTYEVYRDTTQAKSFVRHDQANSVHIDCQMPHEWAGTAVRLHAHTIPMGSVAGNVEWYGFYYFGNANDPLPAVGSWSPISLTDQIVTPQYQRRLTTLAVCAPPATASSSAILSAVVVRNGFSINDSYTSSKDHGTAAANLCIEAIDVHYQRLLTGSRNEGTGALVENPTVVRFDASWLSGTPEVMILARSVGGDPVEFRVWDVGAAAYVGATMTTSSATPVMLSSGALTLAAGVRELRIRGRYTTGADEPICSYAAVLVR